MRTRKIEGRVTLVHSKSGDFLGIISERPDPESQNDSRFYIYVYSPGTQRFESTGWVGFYGDALDEFRVYE